MNRQPLLVLSEVEGRFPTAVIGRFDIAQRERLGDMA